jgi:hypothetical protein
MFPSPYPYVWLEVLSIIPSRAIKVAGFSGDEEFQFENNWICRSEQGIVQLEGAQIEKALALGIYVDAALSDRALKKRQGELHQQAASLEATLINETT